MSFINTGTDCTDEEDELTGMGRQADEHLTAATDTILYIPSNLEFGMLKNKNPWLDLFFRFTKIKILF